MIFRRKTFYKRKKDKRNIIYIVNLQDKNHLQLTFPVGREM